MILTIKQDDPLLRTKADPLTRQMMTPVLGYLAQDMLATVKRLRGYGLAAPQVGHPWRLLVIPEVVDGNDYAMVNPEIIEQSGQQTMLEGCLSFAGLKVKVTRPAEIYFKYLDLEGGEHKLVATGMLAQVFHHEWEHLEAVSIIDHAGGYTRSAWRDKVRKREKLLGRHPERFIHA